MQVEKISVWFHGKWKNGFCGSSKTVLSWEVLTSRSIDILKHTSGLHGLIFVHLSLIRFVLRHKIHLFDNFVSVRKTVITVNHKKVPILMLDKQEGWNIGGIASGRNAMRRMWTIEPFDSNVKKWDEKENSRFLINFKKEMNLDAPW